jgi:hypothetical protein
MAQGPPPKRRWCESDTRQVTNGNTGLATAATHKQAHSVTADNKINKLLNLSMAEQLPPKRVYVSIK